MKMSVLALALFVAAPATAAPQYGLVESVELGAPDRWDYVVYNRETGRVYVAHSDRVAVVDAEIGSLIGNVTGIPGGTHGIAISAVTGQGFTDDGDNGKAVAFDLHTLKIISQIPVKIDADAVALDPVTGRIFVVEGDSQAINVIDPKTNKVIATINAGEKLEYAAADGRGSLFVAGEEKGDLLKIDTRSNRIAARWSAPGCTLPHGVAVDPPNRRVFMGCVNGTMIVADSSNGRIVAKLAIGKGSDAIAFDSVRKRVFSSNGADGSVSIFQQNSSDGYIALAPLATIVSARTMAIDPASGKLFVAGAETLPNPMPGTKPKVRTGTLRLMIFKPRS